MGPVYLPIGSGGDVVDVLEKNSLPTNRPVLIVVGSASSTLDGRIDDVGVLLQEAVMPWARAERAVVVTGGTDAGIMRLVGRELGGDRSDIPLIGVAPRGKLTSDGSTDVDAVDLEPRHRWVLGADGAGWGDEAATLIRVAEWVAGTKPVLVLAIGGGPGTLRELRMATTRRWPILLLNDVGGTSRAVSEVAAQGERSGSQESHQVLAGQWNHDKSTETALNPDEMRAASIAARRWVQDNATRMTASSVDNRSSVRRTLYWLATDDTLLKDAWVRYAEIDDAATTLKKRSRRALAFALLLAVATVAVAIARSRWHGEGADPLLYILTALPLCIGVVVVYHERLGDGKGWVETRHIAEAVIGEIYRFRATAQLHLRLPIRPTAHELLAARLGTLDLNPSSPRSLLRLQPKRAFRSIFPPTLESVHVDDSLLTPLDGPTYDRVRASEQLTFHRHDASKGRVVGTRHIMYLAVAAAIATFGLSGTWGDRGWSSGAIAVGGAFTVVWVSWREYEQRDRRSVSFALTASTIANARARWQALEPQTRRTSKESARFAEEVEDALAAQNQEWRQFSDQAVRAVVSRTG